MKTLLFFVAFTVIFFSAVLSEGNTYTSVSGQSLEKDTNLSECDQVIDEQYGLIRSPGFPDKYPRYSRCQYIIHRYSHDTCEVKLTMQRFDVAKMLFSNCSADFFEIQNGRKRYKLCGELPTGSKRFVFFPDGSDRLVFKFQSTFHQMRGFSIEIKQLPFSCKKNTRIPTRATMRIPPPCVQEISGRNSRITYPDSMNQEPSEKCTYKIKKSEDRACVVQLDFSSFNVSQSAACQKYYLKMPNGHRLCGVLGGSRKVFPFPPDSDELMLEFVTNMSSGDNFDILVSQLPGPCEYDQPTETNNRTGKHYQQCDQTIEETSGRITSPGFPGTFGPNYRCTYKIFRPDPSVCQIELVFLTFSLGRHNPSGCTSGAFLELPGKNKLCHDLNGKMIIKVSEYKDPVVFYFESDSHASGRGFEIIATQIPNTCPGYNEDSAIIPNLVRRCYQEVTSHSGHFSSSNIQFHFPFGMPMWCEFVVRRADPTVCKLKLQITAKSFLNLPCLNNFIHLPNGERMCVSVTERREYWFPEDSEYITLVYYNTNNPDFNLFVDQVSDSCKTESLQSHSSKRRRWAWNIKPR